MVTHWPHPQVLSVTGKFVPFCRHDSIIFEGKQAVKGVWQTFFCFHVIVSFEPDDVEFVTSALPLVVSVCEESISQSPLSLHFTEFGAPSQQRSQLSLTL